MILIGIHYTVFFMQMTEPVLEVGHSFGRYEYISMSSSRKTIPNLQFNGHFSKTEPLVKE